MSEQYEKGSLVARYLDALKVHPMNVAEAVSDDKYRKSYQLIMDNPKISKKEFLEKMEIEEIED